jgi:hypothetical protein
MPGKIQPIEAPKPAVIVDYLPPGDAAFVACVQARFTLYESLSV